MRVFVLTYLCSVVGAYSCAVDAEQCIRALRRVGCVGATVCEARLNAETPTGECLLANGATSEVQCYGKHYFVFEPWYHVECELSVNGSSYQCKKSYEFMRCCLIVNYLALLYSLRRVDKVLPMIGQKRIPQRHTSQRT